MNGMINCSVEDHRYEDTCSFTCNTGYELTGSDTRTCQSDGSWSGNDTLCRQGNLLHTLLCNAIAIGFANFSACNGSISCNHLSHCLLTSSHRL